MAVSDRRPHPIRADVVWRRRQAVRRGCRRTRNLRVRAWGVRAMNIPFLALPLIVLASAAAVAPKSGAAMCVLTPADFQTVGITNAAKPNANVQDSGASVYCVYAGKSAATGGIELDVFNPAGANAADAKETFKTSISEGGGAMKPLTIAGADEAQWSPNAVSGGPPFATVTVRRGTLVFSLSVPARASAQDQLTKLSLLVLSRFQ